MVYRRDYRRGVSRNKKKKNFLGRTSLTNLIILINVVIFVLAWILLIAGQQDFLLNYFALSPSLFLKGMVWTVITSMFMHVLFVHLFVNMVSLFYLGNFVEKLVGRKRYLWFYFIAGIVGGLSFVGFAYLGQFITGGEAWFGGINIFAIGASGALFGLGGLLAVLIPKLRVLVFFIVPMPMWLAMVVLMFGFWALSGTAGWPIGNTAHLGGLVVGVVYGLYLRKRYSRKVKMLNRMFV